MPRFHVVVADAEVAHAREIHRNIEANVAVHGEAHRAKIRVLVEARFPYAPRPVGTVHDTAESECPDGLPNCRNCGDPVHADTCRAAGHCPHCGTRHGIAPDAVLRANGYVLTEAP